MRLEAGERFERPMLRAYETGVVATLPAIKLVSLEGFEPSPHGPKPCMPPGNTLERLNWCPMTESNCHPLITKQVFYHLTNRAKYGGPGRIRTYSPEGTDLQSAATLQLSR